MSKFSCCQRHNPYVFNGKEDMDSSMTKKSGYIPVDNTTSSNYPSESQHSHRFHGSSNNPVSRQSKPPFGWSKIPYLSKFSANSVNPDSTKTTTPSSCSVSSTTSTMYPETLPPSSPSQCTVTEPHPAIIEIREVGRIHPWSSCVWKPKDYQRHAPSPMDFLLWSSHNNLAETYFPKVSRMGLLILDQHVVQSHNPWHMQKESAKPSSFFDYSSSHDDYDDDDQEDEDENTDDALFCGKQLYPTRYFVSNNNVDSSSQNMTSGDNVLPMVPLQGNKVSSKETEQGWTEYDEWYTRTYHQWIGSANSSRIHDERMDFPYLKLNRGSMRMDCPPLPKDSLTLYKELDPFKIQPYTVQSKRIASTMYTYSAVADCTLSPVPNMICLSSDHSVYICDLGLTNRQCDLIIHTAERCANGTYAAYTYAKQTLGCRDYDALGLVCEWPVLKVCATINKYLENPTIAHKTSAMVGNHSSSSSSSSSEPRRRILSLDDREPHIVKYDVSKKERQKLDMHTDKSEWTFIIALSEGRGKDFECGGTYIEAIDSTIHLQRGQVLIFPGKLRHRGQKITKGIRYLLVGFMVDKGPSLVDSSLIA